MQKQKTILIVVVTLAIVGALTAFWALYLRHTPLYVSLFKTEAAQQTRSCADRTTLTQDEMYSAWRDGFFDITMHPEAGSIDVNNKTECAGPISVVIMQANGAWDAQHQQYFSGQYKLVAAHTSQTLTATKPTCNYQIDVLYGADSSKIYAGAYLAGPLGKQVTLPGGFCTAAPPPVVTCNDAVAITRADAARFLVQKLPLTINTNGGPHFGDVAISHPDYASIETVYNRGLAAGCSAGPLNYCPSAPATRGQYATFVVKAKGLILIKPATPSFLDVQKTHSFYEYIETAKAAGLVAGYTDGTFKPDQTIFATEACAMTSRQVSPTPTPTATPTSTPTPTATTISGNPNIDLVKFASPTDLPAGGGTVTYSYTVTNQGDVALSDVSLSDNKCGLIEFLGGDTNNDRSLQVSETWTYQCIAVISATTTNVGTVTAKYNTSTVSSTDEAEVTVAGSQTPVPVLGITIEKLGQDLTRQENTPKNRIDGSPNDVLRFSLSVGSNANVRLDNVIVRDVLPSQLTYLPGTTQVNGGAQADGIIGDGINIGGLNPDQRAVVTFQVKVAATDSFQTGTTVMINSGLARADGVNEQEAKLPVYITKNVLVPVGQVQTGVDGVTLTLLTSLILTFGYHVTTSGLSFLKGTMPIASGTKALLPSKGMLASIAIMLILLAGSLGLSKTLKESRVATIEIPNPVVHTANGSYLSIIGLQFRFK